MKKILHLSLFLGLISAIFGGALAYVNSITAPIIEAQSMAEEAAIFKDLDSEAVFKELDVSADETGLIKNGYYGESSKGKYWIYKSQVVGFNASTPIDFLIGFDADGNIVMYEVTSHKETENLGSRIASEEFAVKGKTVSDSIEIITGSTISSNAVISGINAAKNLYSKDSGVEVVQSEVEAPKLVLGEKTSISRPFSDNKAECVKLDDTSEGYYMFACEADGYGLIDPDDHGISANYSRNKASVIIDPATKSVVSVTYDEFGDTAGIGDKTVNQEYYDTFVGLTFEDEADTVSGATWTSESLISMVSKALSMSE